MARVEGTEGESTVRRRWLTRWLVDPLLDAARDGAAAATADSTPRWKDPTTIIAALALVLSVAALGLERADSAEASDQAKRERLTTKVRELGELPREAAARYLDMQKAGASDPPEYHRAVLSSLNTDRVLLVREAATLVEDIPDLVSSAELYAIALNLQDVGQSDRALDLAERAEARAGNHFEYTAALRLMGRIHYESRRYRQGDRQMERAVDTFEQIPEFGRQTPEKAQDTSDIETYLYWAEMEVSVGRCGAIDHLDAARRLIRKWEPDSAGFRPLYRRMQGSVPDNCS